jgi:hypothetical protein
MSKSKERTYQSISVTPPSLKPARRSPANSASRDDKITARQVDVEEIEQKQDIILRLIDHIKAI